MDPRPMTQSDLEAQGVVHWEFAPLPRSVDATERHVLAGDYARGFRDGAEDAEEARAAQPGDGDLPADDPGQRAYRRGYQAGWDWVWQESMD